MTRKHMMLIDGFVICLWCSGCSRAPSVSIIGSFFPVWMICLVLGVLTALFVRVLLLRNRLETFVKPLWLFYPCAVILTAGFIWIVFYR